MKSDRFGLTTTINQFTHFFRKMPLELLFLTYEIENNVGTRCRLLPVDAQDCDVTSQNIVEDDKL